MSYREFNTRFISKLPVSKKHKSVSRSGDPYHLSLGVISANICSLPGCLNSTSDNSFTVKSRLLQGGGTSGYTLQNKIVLKKSARLIIIKWKPGCIKGHSLVTKYIFLSFYTISIYVHCFK